MQVRVRGYLTLRKSIGDIQLMFVDDPPPTIATLLERLSSTWNDETQALVLNVETGGLNPHVAVLINGRHLTHTPGGLDTPLCDGDEISIFPPIAGG